MNQYYRFLAMLEMTIIQSPFKNWLRTRSTIGFLGRWEKIKEVLIKSFDKLRTNGKVLITFVVSLSNHECNQLIQSFLNNPNFKGVEFDSFNRLLKNVFEAADARQKQAKKRSSCLINEHFEPVFNTAAATQIVFQQPVKSEAGANSFTLSPNLESINAELIRQGIAQTHRITALNQIAIHQMRSLLGAPEIKKLK